MRCTTWIKPLEKPLVLPETREPFVIMFAGINGAGKNHVYRQTRQILQAQGKSVLLAAGDTFRAAAREQLQAWGERNNVTVISAKPQAIPQPFASMPSKPRKRAGSTSCWLILPAVCLRSFI